MKLATCPRYPRYPLHHWLLCHSLHIHTFSRTCKCARCVCARCARFGDRTVPFLVRSGDRTVLLLVLYPLQGCTICRLVSLARPRRLAEPDLVLNSICTVLTSTLSTSLASTARGEASNLPNLPRLRLLVGLRFEGKRPFFLLALGIVR